MIIFSNFNHVLATTNTDYNLVITHKDQDEVDASLTVYIDGDLYQGYVLVGETQNEVTDGTIPIKGDDVVTIQGLADQTQFRVESRSRGELRTDVGIIDAKDHDVVFEAPTVQQNITPSNHENKTPLVSRFDIYNNTDKYNFLSGQEVLLYVGVSLSEESGMLANSVLELVIPKEHIVPGSFEASDITAQISKTVTETEDAYHVIYYLETLAAGYTMDFPLKFKTNNGETPNGFEIKVEAHLSTPEIPDLVPPVEKDVTIETVAPKVTKGMKNASNSWITQNNQVANGGKEHPINQGTLTDVLDDLKSVEFSFNMHATGSGASVVGKRKYEQFIIKDTLPEDQRLCVFLYYFKEYSISEIAHFLDVKENTVKSRLRVGKARIKQSIEDKQEKGTVLFSVAPLSIFFYGLTQGISEVNPPFDFSDIVTLGLGTKVISFLKGIFAKKAVIVTIGSVATLGTLGYGMAYYKPAEPVNKVDVFDYVTLVYEGYECEVTEQIIYEGADEALMSLTFLMDVSDGLCNEDEITVTLGNVDSVDTQKVEVLRSSQKYTVSNLDPITSINIMDYLRFDISGFDGEASLQISFIKDSVEPKLIQYIESLSLEYHPQKNLGNGDTIQIKIREKETVSGYELVHYDVQYTVNALASRPKPIDHRTLILNRLKQYTSRDFIQNFLNQSTVDYHGNEIDVSSFEIVNTRINIGKISGKYVSYVEMTLSDHDREFTYALASHFDENIEGQSNVYAISMDQKQGLNAFK